MKHTPEFYAVDRAAWRRWLEDNHEAMTAIWLVFDKGEKRTMKWEDIVQEALCFGWIDSLPRKRDDGKSMIYVSRRKPKSVWSKINKGHVEKMREARLMTAAGEAAIETAHDNGTWYALDDSDNLVLPPLLIKLLENEPDAQRNFNAFTSSARKQLLQWIYGAKREATKEKRIRETVTAAKMNRKAFEWLKKQ